MTARAMATSFSKSELQINMLNRLKNLLHPPEDQSLAHGAPDRARESAGRARWTPRDYAALAREGYVCNAIVHRAVKLVAENAAACAFLLYEGAVERDPHPLLDLSGAAQSAAGRRGVSRGAARYLLLAGNAYVEAVAIEGQDGMHTAAREIALAFGVPPMSGSGGGT